ncbi:signal recognition particle-docking protein FtsY [Streptococcus mitis]|uniref:signal recognition particle-docking protein FtsY n=1 Tax=Streptococcus mitis TaxID=28037 RepID=UPI0021B6DD07|nr:signal recognition particle-docking protein FtsY [Streptococcus mitis]
MGLFDRLFGKKEEPKIEEVVKEALENLDLSEDTEAEEVSQEDAEVEIVEQAELQEDKIQDTVEESLDSEPVVEIPQEEIEEFVNSEEVSEKENYEFLETVEENSSEVLEPETSQVEETVQEKYDRSLKKTRTGFGARLNAFFANFRSVDEEFFEELEELLIMSDVGVQVASNLTEELRYEAKLENAKKPDALRRVIIEKLVELYEKDGNYDESIHFQDGLTVMLFVGVNGVGKTTSIGKLAHRYKQAGKKVMLVAADTFRAGAVAQLAEWGRRVDVPVVTGPEKADPASVVFDGMERAVAEGIDILMIDTAGRLQNKDNLMAELEKIGRIIKRVVPEAPHETFLALDASTGQNALVQAKEFSKITPLTGIVLTKIDGTARGGVVLAIREELNIPVKLIGFGEKIDDIGEFNSENFMKGLLEGLI